MTPSNIDRTYPPVMFVVTGLHTKRRPSIDIPTKSIATAEEQQRINRHIAESRPHRPLRTVESYSSRQPTQCCVSKPTTMTRNDGVNKPPPAAGRLPVWKPPAAPPRIRKFIPKPLILVERMKARRQLLLVNLPSPYVVSEPHRHFVPESSNCPMAAAITMPVLAYATPTKYQTPTRDTPLSYSCSTSGSVSIRISSQSDIMMRSLSVVTLANSSSSTDTFVADSPCWMKQPFSNVPLLVTGCGVANVYSEVGGDPGKKCVFSTGAPVLLDSVDADFMNRTCHLTDVFEPTLMSTPHGSSKSDIDIDNVLLFPSLGTSTAHPPEQLPALFNGSEIASSTSRAVYSFNAPIGPYTVKLPNSRSSVALLDETRLATLSDSTMSHPKPMNSEALFTTSANASKSASDLRRTWRRVNSPSPTLVLDGVFALPHAPPPSLFSPQKTTRRPLSELPQAFTFAAPFPTANLSPTAVVAASSPQLLLTPTPWTATISGERLDAESPRSKLARVLTASASTNVNVNTNARENNARENPHASVYTNSNADASPRIINRTRWQGLGRRRGSGSGRGTPSSVKGTGVRASNERRTRVKFEGLEARARRSGSVGLGRPDGGEDLGRNGSGKTMMDRPSLSSRVGMVAKLRARWEAGTVGQYCHGFDGCA